MKTNKLLVFATIALLLINLVLAYFLWNNKKSHDRRGGGKGERGDWMVNELKLNDSQKEEHRKIKDAHFAALKPVFDSISSARKSLYSLVKDSSAPDSLRNHYINIIGEQHSLISRYTFDHFQKIRAICNPEQQQKLDSLVQKIVVDMGKRGSAQGRRGEQKSK